MYCILVLQVALFFVKPVDPQKQTRKVTNGALAFWTLQSLALNVH